MLLGGLGVLAGGRTLETWSCNQPLVLVLALVWGLVGGLGGRQLGRAGSGQGVHKRTQGLFGPV